MSTQFKKIGFAAIYLLLSFIIPKNATCQTTYTSTDIPKVISTSPETITSTLTIGDNFLIGDINVSLDISHTYIQDLTITLTSPNLTIVSLITTPCGDFDDIMVIIDDEGTATLPCPPTDSNNYQPTGNLSDFDSQSNSGTWTLTITDSASGDGGSLNAWSLSILESCSVTAPTLSKL